MTSARVVAAQPPAPRNLRHVAPEDVALARVEFRGRGATNRLEAARKPGLGTSGMSVDVGRGGFRHTYQRNLTRRATVRLFTFFVWVSAGWLAHVEAPEGAETRGFGWRLELLDARGRALRVCAGEGRIAESETFLAFARGVEVLARGLVTDVMPLVRIEHALARRDPLAYDVELDRVAAGAIECALATDYYHEALLAPASAHRDEAMNEAKARFAKAALLGSAQAFASMGNLASEEAAGGDVVRVRAAYERAVADGSAEGCFRLADMLREGGPRDRIRARELYVRAYELLAHSQHTEAWSLAAARLGSALAEGVGGVVDLARALDLVMEAELGLTGACNQGQVWLRPELERVTELSERLHASGVVAP